MLVEMKDESQIEADEVQNDLAKALKNNDKDYIDVDDTANIRTMIVNIEFESDFNRYQINIDWSLK